MFMTETLPTLPSSLQMDFGEAFLLDWQHSFLQ